MNNNSISIKLHTAKATVNRAVEDLGTLANAKELDQLQILQMVLRKMSWDLDNASCTLGEVNNDFAYTEPHEGELRDQLTRLQARCIDMQNRLLKYEPADKLTDDEHNLASTGQKIAAIKAIRQRTNLGLKEAKDLVEKFYPYLPSATSPSNVPF